MWLLLRKHPCLLPLFFIPLPFLPRKQPAALAAISLSPCLFLLPPSSKWVFFPLVPLTPSDSFSALLGCLALRFLADFTQRRHGRRLEGVRAVMLCWLPLAPGVPPHGWVWQGPSPSVGAAPGGGSPSWLQGHRLFLASSGSGMETASSSLHL